MSLFRLIHGRPMFFIAVTGMNFCLWASGHAAEKILPTQSTVTMSGIVTTPERKASPHFDGDVLPDPPAQKQPWVEPASTLPDSFVSATRSLFDQGMADPRGCDYREIEVGTGNVWRGDNGVIKTHGWVLPGKEKQRFAVCWNGLVHPVVSVGGAADWRQDVKAALGHARNEYSFVHPEVESVSWETCLPIKGCLVLRLGDPKLAEEIWRALQIARYRDALLSRDRQLAPDHGPTSEFDTGDPYYNWASDWIWSLYDRAICAHMRGDDRLALLSARSVEVARPVLEVEAARRGIKNPYASGGSRNGKVVPRFGFLNSVRALYRDQARRASASKQPVAMVVIKDPAASQIRRIEALIRDLDQVAVRQGGQPVGPFNITEDPIVAALIREGESGIEPLLLCLESETANHLTRSVTFGRDFHSGRDLHTLVMPIRAVLLAVMKTTQEAVGVTSKDRYEGKLTAKDEAARFRAWWQRYGAVPEIERWHRTLADDTAGKAAWIDAAQQLVRKPNDLPLAGEPLRAKSKPTVSELLVKRAQGFARDRTNWRDSRQGFHDGDTARFIQTCMKWEAAPMVPAAKELMQTIFANYGANPKRGHPSQSDGRTLAELTTARATHGDMDAVEEWCAWIRGRSPDDLGSYPGESLRPFWRFADQPANRTVSRQLFGDSSSPWCSLLDPAGRSWGMLRESTFEMLVVQEVRMRWLDYLQDRRDVGTAEMTGDDHMKLEITGVRSSNRGMVSNEKRTRVGTTVTIRKCDVAADCLSRVPGFPEFSFFWSEKDRESALSSMKELLGTMGHRLRVVEGERFSFAESTVRFEFPKRDRPASRVDVEKGDAIFHLDQGQIEIIPLPMLPIKARLKSAGREEVLVWQAEQFRTKGRVHRFYGIVRSHRVEKVSVAQVELESEDKQQ